jgi:hypothetical protein
MQGVAATKKTLTDIIATLRQLPGSAAGSQQWGLCAAALKGILISDDPCFLRQYIARSDLFELVCKGLAHGLQLLVADTAGSAAAPSSCMATPPLQTEAAAAPPPKAAAPAATSTVSALPAAPTAAAAEVPEHLDLGALTLLALAV